MSDTEKYRKSVEGTFERLTPPKKILLVDDNQVDIELVLRELRHFNVETTVFRCSEEASKHARIKKYDFVMFDLMMPGMDGIDFMLGTVHFQPKASYLLLTGYPMSPKTDAVRKLGAIHLCKPVTRDVLQDILPRKPLTSHKRTK